MYFYENEEVHSVIELQASYLHSDLLSKIEANAPMEDYYYQVVTKKVYEDYNSSKPET